MYEKNRYILNIRDKNAHYLYELFSSKRIFFRCFLVSFSNVRERKHIKGLDFNILRESLMQFVILTFNLKFLAHFEISNVFKSSSFISRLPSFVLYLI